MNTNYNEALIDTYEINSLPIYELNEEFQFQFQSIEDKQGKEDIKRIENAEARETIQLDKYNKKKFEIIFISKKMKIRNSKDDHELVRNSIQLQPKESSANPYILLNSNDYYDISEHVSNNEFHNINQSD